MFTFFLLMYLFLPIIRIFYILPIFHYLFFSHSSISSHFLLPPPFFASPPILFFLSLYLYLYFHFFFLPLVSIYKLFFAFPTAITTRKKVPKQATCLVTCEFTCPPAYRTANLPIYQPVYLFYSPAYLPE